MTEKSKVYIVGSILVMVLLIIGVLSSLYKTYKLDQKVDSLSSQVSELNKKYEAQNENICEVVKEYC